jgi:hypothetical protein
VLRFGSVPAVSPSALHCFRSPTANRSLVNFQFGIQVTRDLIRAGQLLKIDVLDHIVIGNGNHTSLRATGDYIFP